MTSKESCIFSILHSQALPTVCLAFPGHIREQMAMPQQGGYGILTRVLLKGVDISY